jgi:hypothetical protein
MVAVLTALVVVAGKRIFKLVEGLVESEREQSKENRLVFRQTIDKMSIGHQEALKNISEQNRQQLATTLERLELMFGHHTTVIAGRLRSVETSLDDRAKEPKAPVTNVIG